MSDTVPPVLRNLVIPKEIDLSKLDGNRVTFRIEASDGEGGSGIASVTFGIDRFLTNGSGGKHVGLSFGVNSADGEFISDDTFGDATPTTANLSYRVGKGTPSGVVTIEDLWVIDHSNHASIYTTAQLQALGFDTQIRLVNPAAAAAPVYTMSAAVPSALTRVFEGSGQANSTVYMAGFMDGTWYDIGSGQVGADGAWKLETRALADGVYERVSAWTVDSKGNASFMSAWSTFDVWKDGLVAPTMVLPVDADGRLRTDNPVIQGTAIADAKVTVFADGHAIGTATADAGGLWSLLTSTLASGEHAFTAVQTTTAGRTSSASTAQLAKVNVGNDGLKFKISSLTSAPGVAADQEYIQNMLDDAAARLSEFLDANITIPFNVKIEQLGQPVGAAGANWLGLDPSGQPMLGQATLLLDIDYPALFQHGANANPYLYAHEMLHVLGFANGIKSFNDLIRKQGDVAYFYGANAMALNGGPVRLDASLSHLDSQDDIMGSGGGSLFSPTFAHSNPWRPFSSLDIAILKDLGWNTKPVLSSVDGHVFIAGSGKSGFNQVDGTAALDTFVVSQARNGFAGEWVNGKYVLSSTRDASSHSLTDIERIQFSDKVLALDIDGTAGQVYRLYQAVLGRTPDAAGLGFWIGNVDKGATLAQVADQFVASAEFKKLYGIAPTPEEILIRLYANVLQRDPDQPGFDYWLPIIQRDPELIEEVLVAFSESIENKKLVADIIGNGFEYQPYG